MLIDIHSHQNSTGEYFVLYNAFLEKYSDSCSYGIHPWHIGSDFEAQLNRLNKLVVTNNCLAIGECGLDKLSDVDFQIQIEVFEKQIELSERIEKPLIIHCVKATNELIQLKKKFKPKKTWIFHGFRKVNTFSELKKEGIKIGIGATILKDKSLQELVKIMPIDSFFLETDDAQNAIVEIYEMVAELRNIELDQLIKSMKNNFELVFQVKAE